jgi:hypothetical protein
MKLIWIKNRDKTKVWKRIKVKAIKNQIKKGEIIKKMKYKKDNKRGRTEDKCFVTRIASFQYLIFNINFLMILQSFKSL